MSIKLHFFGKLRVIIHYVVSARTFQINTKAIAGEGLMALSFQASGLVANQGHAILSARVNHEEFQECSSL